EPRAAHTGRAPGCVHPCQGEGRRGRRRRERRPPAPLYRASVPRTKRPRTKRKETVMTAASTGTYIALFTGNRESARSQAFFTLPEAERKAKEQEGIAAWGAWMQKHHDAVVFSGGPLGKTKLVSPDGIADITNKLGGFVVVRGQQRGRRQ